MRRRVDQVWAVTAEEWGLSDEDQAKAVRIADLLREGEPPEPVPAGVPKRPAPHDLHQRSPSDIFRLLGSHTHHPAAWMLNQLYLALPNPDANWAADCQTSNFHTRPWKLNFWAAFESKV